MEGYDVSFKYITDKGEISTKLANTEGAFIQICNNVVTIQPFERILMFPHIGYPSESGDKAIVIKRADSTTMGDFSWGEVALSSFGDSINYTFIDDSKVRSSWYPISDEAYLPAHARLCNLTSVPGEFYVNALIGDSDDLIVISNVDATIKQNNNMSLLPDVPYIMSDGGMIWVAKPSNVLDTKVQPMNIADNQALNYYSRYSKLYVPTIASAYSSYNNDILWTYKSNLNNNAYTEDHFFMGYLNDLMCAFDYGDNNKFDYLHIKTQNEEESSKHEFLNINIHRPYFRCNAIAEWYGEPLSACNPEEIESLDNGHAELIDGMWVDITYVTE